MSAAGNWIVPDWPAPPRVRAAITTRAGGVSRGTYASLNLGARVGDAADAVARNRAILRRHLPSDPVWMKQVHGTRVVEAGPKAAGEEADAAVARAPGRVCAVLSADCLPLLLAAADGTAVGIAHAGWRGLAAGVVENLVDAMGMQPGAMLAYLGPAIGAGAYEVGSDVLEAFVARDEKVRTAFAPLGRGKFLADLCGIARHRLARLGVESVYGGTLCTYAESARFFSYRRDGATGRMASLIWIE